MDSIANSVIKHRFERERLDPCLMARRGGIVPDSWQADLLRSDARQVILNCSRQSGKSTITSILALHQAIFTPDSLILLLSPSLRQSQELFRKLKDFYNAVGCDSLPQISEESTLRLEFHNGSRVVALPGSEQTVRGYSAVSLLIVDEASRIDDALYFSIKPMLGTSNGKLILLSSPYGRRGIFYDIWENGGNDWMRIKVVATRCPRISSEFLESERRTLPSFWFEQEYMGIFRETLDSVFSFAEVQATLSDKIEPFYFEGDLV
jgi:hypothetical protein